MAHWNTLEFISQMPNCANHPIYPTHFIPMEKVTIFLSKFAPKVKPERSTKSLYYHGCDYLTKVICDYFNF